MKARAMLHTLYYYISSMFTHKGLAVLALWFAVFRELFAKYIFNDWQFVAFLFVLIVADTVFGIGSSIKNNGWRSLSIKEGEKVLVKIFLYFGVLVLSHVLGNFTIHGKQNEMFTWIDGIIYGYMMGKEGLSVAKNINSINPSYVPPFIINRLKVFEKSGKISDLFKDAPETPEQP